LFNWFGLYIFKKFRYNKYWNINLRSIKWKSYLHF
jgi:hypothetical protein